MSFSNLKKNRSNNFSKLVQEAEKINSGGGSQNKYGDDRVWKPTVDKSGNGYAVIRFLLQRKAKSCHGYVTGIMDSRALRVSGTLNGH